jgi:erythromycin esterase-like protein
VESRVAVDLAHAISPLQSGIADDTALFEIVGDASVVLIGEATHGTHEFYRARAEVTKRLIVDRGFNVVCIEGDWPDAYRVNRYVRGAGDDAEAIESLEGFERFPSWMWRNPVVLDFIGWLRDYNQRSPLAGRSKAGFSGLDLYGMYAKLDGQVAADRFLQHLALRQGATKAIVWAHNSHVGNADATAMALRNETNLGALARQAFGDAAVSIGFTTYTGTVTAAPEWQAPPERKHIVPARGDSYEYLFHSLKVPRFLVPLRSHRPRLPGLPAQARERAIGAIHSPQAELYSHYFTARLIDQFDAIYHFDVTHALEPLDPGERWQRGEPPEGYSTERP